MLPKISDTFWPIILTFESIFRHLESFQINLKQHSKDFYSEDMKVEAMVVRKESFDNSSYFSGSKLYMYCFQCKLKYAFLYYDLPTNFVGISGQPLAISSQSEFPKFHLCPFLAKLERLKIKVGNGQKSLEKPLELVIKGKKDFKIDHAYL